MRISKDKPIVVLSQEAIRSLVSMDECIRLQRDAFAWITDGKVLDAEPTRLEIREGKEWLRVLVGFVHPLNVFSVKATVRIHTLPSRRNFAGLIILYDGDDGLPVALMDAAYISALRTGAASAVAAEFLARPSPTTVGIIGSGVTARYSLLALRSSFPSIQMVKVHSRNPNNRIQFANQMGRLTGLRTLPVDEAQAVAEDADILVVGTNSPLPVLSRNSIRPGTHVGFVGGSREVSPEIFLGTKIVVDSRESCAKTGKVALALKAGLISPEDIYADLGELVLGRKPGRTHAEEVTMFDSSGLPAQDAVVAHHVYRKALSRGEGEAVFLGLDSDI